MRRSIDLAVACALVCCLGCGGAPPVCEQMCTAALDTVGACLDEWGLDWGDSLGYADAEDHANWCATYVDEQLELAAARWGSEGYGRVEQVCADQEQLLADRPCDGYHDSWDLWTEFSEGS